MKKSIWSIKMKNAHQMARRISDFNYNSYKENLSIAMKVQHMILRQITLADINWLMNYLGSRFVTLNLHHLKKTALFEITGGVSEIDVYHYVRPRTDEENEIAIGVMIESERKSGIKVNLD
ncbi:MAG: hypothetical protein V3W20_02870 [Candidatus Neomarinimicrobiota bacterium]